VGALIDSSVFIAAERGTLDLQVLVEDYGETTFAMSAVTASELLHGVHRANTAKRRMQREAFVEALLSQFPVISFDLVVARTYARLFARLASKGTQVGAHDLIIAATAVARGMDVATRDERSFRRIPDLNVHPW
jgi:predicted nucleic acid-binding protein